MRALWSRLKTIPHWLIITKVFFIFGLAFVILSPPGQVPDEFGHIWRAYQITRGEFLPKTSESQGIKRYGGNIDTKLVDYSFIQADLDASPEVRPLSKNFEPNEAFSGTTRYMQFDNIAAYSPLMYLPSAAAVSIGRLFTMHVATVFYMARVFNLLTITTFVGLGCWLVRKKLTAPLLIVLLPSSVFLAGSISQDGLIIGASFLAASACIALCRGLATKPAAIALAVSLLLITSAKLPYLPLLAFLYVPLFFINKTQRKRYFIGSLVAGLFILGYGVLWHSIVSDVNIAAIMPSKIAGTNHVDPQVQNDLLQQHPGRVITLLYHTNLSNYSDHFMQEVFGMFGYGENGSIVLPNSIIISWLVVVCALLGNILRPRWRKLVSWAGLLAIAGIGLAFLLSEYALYAYWTGVGRQYIEGLQGRYFIPLLIFGLAFICCIETRKNGGWLRTRHVLIPAVVINLLAIILVVQTYYRPV